MVFNLVILLCIGYFFRKALSELKKIRTWLSQSKIMSMKSYEREKKINDILNGKYE